MRAALYARLSREDANKDIKIPEQLRMCREYAEAQGWQVVLDEFDDGISGTVEARPGLQRVLAAARRGEIDVVVARDQDRLARDGDDDGLAGWVRHEFVRNGVRVVTLLEIGASPIERGVRTLIGGEYVRRTRELITAKLRGKAGRGEYCGGGSALGYRWTVSVPPEEEARLREARRTVPRHLEIVPAEASQIRRLFQMLDPKDRRATIRATSRALDWHRQITIRRARNPVYAGGFAYGKKKVVRGRRGSFVKRPRSEWLVIWDHHEPIVPKDQWDRVQERLAGVTAGWNGRYGPSTARLALTGLLRCSECGGLMCVTGATKPRKDGSKIRYYVCRKWRDTGTCPGVGFQSTDGWVPALAVRLIEILSQKPMVKTIHAEIVAAYEAGKDRGHQEAEVRRRERAVETVMAIIRSGEVTDTTRIARELQAAQDALESARKALARHRKTARKIPSIRDLTELLEAMTEDLRTLADHPPADLDVVARPLFHKMIESITVPARSPATLTICPTILGDSLPAPLTERGCVGDACRTR